MLPPRTQVRRRQQLAGFRQTAHKASNPCDPSCIPMRLVGDSYSEPPWSSLGAQLSNQKVGFQHKDYPKYEDPYHAEGAIAVWSVFVHNGNSYTRKNASSYQNNPHRLDNISLVD